MSEPTRAKIIIVGLGLGGLALAIECRRKGHTVIAVDQQRELRPIGDSIGIPYNAKRIIKTWGNGSVDRKLTPLLNKPASMIIRDCQGDVLAETSLAGYGADNGYPCHRGELVMVFYEHALELGVEFRLGTRVSEYWEDDDHAGIMLNGEKITADCVVGADGVHSKARGAITGGDATPHSSGYAMYRAWFSADAIRADPETRYLVENCEHADRTDVYIAEDLHMMIGTGKLGKEVFWMCTHKDIYDVGESWSYPGDVDDMLDLIKDWPVKSTLEKIVRKTPKDCLIDYKLLWRDPLPTWISSQGRMMVIGDAAHPFLPTSGQGAAQAIEDAVTLAACLDLGGKARVKEAIQATMAIRYDRATYMQRLGIETRDMWHKTDWDAVKKNPQLLAIPQPEWIFGHDCKAYAYNEFEKVTAAIKKQEKYLGANVIRTGHEDPMIESRQFQEALQN